MSRRSRYALPAAIVVAVALRFVALGHQSFWYDEWDTIAMTQLPFEDMLHRMHVELSPPLYFVLTWAWAKPFGHSEFAIRSISALAGVATVPVLYRAAKELVSERAGLIVAWLVAVNPVLVWYSQEARAYSLMVLLTSVSFLFFVRALNGDRRAVLWWAIASSLAMATHYLAGAVLVPEALWLFFRAPLPRRPIVLGVALIAAVGLALIPGLHSQIGHSGWIGNLQLRPRAEGVAQNMAIGFYAPWWWLPLLPLAGLAAAVAFALRRGTDEERRGLTVAGGVGLVGAAVLVVPVITGNDYVTTRNLLALWVPLGIAAAIGLGARALRWVGAAATAALAALSIGLVAWVVEDPNLQRPDWGHLAAKIEPPLEKRVIASLGARGYNAVPLELYLRNTRRLNIDARPRAAELVLVRTKKIESKAVGTCFWGAICNGNAGGYPFRAPPGFTLVQSGSTDRFEFQLYRAPHPIQLPRMAQRGRFLQYPGP